jgi:pPIWI RE three-gene island domain Z
MFTYTLFKPPDIFERRIKELDLEETLAKLLLQVELGFALTEYLQIDDEPVTVVCEILSKTLIRHPRLENLSPESNRAIANARQIVPFSSRFSWLNALQDYMRKIPQEWRNYNFDPQDLDNQIINAAKNLQQQANQTIYDFCLRTQLEFRTRKREQVEAETYYQIESATEDEPKVRLHVNFTPAQVRTNYPLPWLPPKNRRPIEINISDLEQAAIFLDNREEELARQYSWSNTARGNWLRRFRKLNYHKVLPNNIVEEQRAETINIDGFTHIAGIVASGKSTLSILIAVHIIKNNLDYRLTIVVGDTQAEIKLANQFNWWFCNDPEQDEPVAVPILGGSQRDKHLRGFSGSNDYLAHLERGQPHWGERWLSIVCPLQARISQSDRINILNGKPLTPGKEPCHSLQRAPRDRNKKATGKSHFCPLFNCCPSKQAYRDMPAAKVWVTTPGAMAQGGMPYHYELRYIKFGELVYEQSDIVIFDEVDTVIEWFDKVYAEQVTITNSNDGVFDEIGIKTEQYARNNRVPPRVQQRWNSAQRQGQNAITTTLTLLNPNYGHQILRDWTSRGYFTPHVLFFKLARRLAGLEEYNSYRRSEQQIRRDNRLVQWIMRYFDAFLREDPTKDRTGVTPPIARLVQIAQRINSTGDSATDDAIYLACKSWITQFFPNTSRRLEKLAVRLWIYKNQNSQQTISLSDVRDELDTIDSLALRLQFALTITLLDRHTKIVFYEWQNRPSTIPEAPPHRRMPSAMYNILSLPVTGREFGTYSSRNNDNTLTLFAYTNIGRQYVLDYHNLLTDFDGQRGANVLALSGTSYLPDSTTFHVNDPQGVLKPEETAQDAIGRSKFQFLPQFDGKDRPIRVSGSLSSHKKAKPKFQELAQSLVTTKGSNHLVLELQTLRQLGESNPEHWADRDRVLLLTNSYEQAEWVADEMRSYLPNMREQIRHLVSDNAEKSKRTKPGALIRADIEIFGQTNGKILIAPTNSIGRGFNILNSKGKAAFGAVYFLTRPYPHADDTQAIAQEMNRRAYDWLAKEDFIAWQQGDGIAHRAELLRTTANRYWRSVEQRSYYKTLRDNENLCAFPRYDLAATTLGRIIQAVGRLIRGGVPFHGYFVDSAWADNSAKKLAATRVGDDPDSIDNDTEENSLLVATILRICTYAEDNSVGNALYKPLAVALENIEDVFF